MMDAVPQRSAVRPRRLIGVALSDGLNLFVVPGARSDAARAAARLASAYEEPPVPLTESAGGAALRASGHGGDIAFCARGSVLTVVPRVTAASAGVAVVCDHLAMAAPSAIDPRLTHRVMPNCTA
jgi:hypothetical protein